MPHIILDDIVINIERKKVKNLRLAVYAPEGRVRVAAPMRMSDKIIQAFIISKMPWIKKHLAKVVRVPQEVLTPEAQRVMDKSNRAKLNLIIPDLMQKWQEIIGVEVAEYKIKKMKTRWGTCNTRDRRIWINLELAKKSLNCLEYIIVHELVHLLERSHNARFKSFMDKFMPQWRSYKAELKCAVLSS